MNPPLTPSDVKLAAYLRMNLSTKEIAQLLNITNRSVELKRYRLRKKMNLESGVNLGEFMRLIEMLIFHNINPIIFEEIIKY